jgi:hypothetical protein
MRVDSSVIAFLTAIPFLGSLVQATNNHVGAPSLRQGDKQQTGASPWANNTTDEPLHQKNTLELHYEQYLQIREQRSLMKGPDEEEKVRGSTVYRQWTGLT